MAKGTTSHISKDMQMANMHMKICSVLQVIKDMHIKLVKILLYTTRIAKKNDSQQQVLMEM